MLIRILMLFIPFDYITVNSIYSPEEIKGIIDKHIRSGEYFEGISKERSFKVKRRLNSLLWIGLDDYKPIITGKVSENINGSRIEIFPRLRYKVLIIYILIVSIFFTMIIKNNRIDIGGVIVVVFLYLAILMFYKQNYFNDIKRLKDLLEENNPK